MEGSEAPSRYRSPPAVRDGDRCLTLFEHPEVLQNDVNFPVLKGFYSDRRVTLEPIADHIAYRKLPQLWLRATTARLLGSA
jgi:hypothetical protein